MKFRKMVHQFDRALSQIEVVFMAIAAILLFVMIFTVCFSVVGRYFF